MTSSPIPKVLSTFRRRKVRALLMGGQACILYGAAEFSRDVDFAVAVSPRNLDRLRAALRDLRAEPVYFPPLGEEALARGHACHFRCRAPGLRGVRVDLMGRMRGADAFERLWARRARLKLAQVGVVDVVSLPDLVAIKKTQRDKDWPMVRRLVDADIASAAGTASGLRRRFWLRECRSPELLCGLVGRYPADAARLARKRPAIAAARGGRIRDVERELRREEDRERRLDRRYWAPLRAELEAWRLRRRRTV